MPANLINKFPDLYGRINRFLSSKTLGREEVGDFINNLKETGDIALFGGMLRDLSIEGNTEFNSDIDLVITSCSDDELDRTLVPYEPIKNKFGGYRISLSKWKIDIWQLKSTWAFKMGYVEEGSFESLYKTTFFDWDGIAFDIKRKKIIAIDSYIERLHSGILDINLEQNPNPIGNVIRAFRYCEKYNAQFSSKLARYIYTSINNINEEQLVSFERNSHDWPVLNKNSISNIIHSLKEHQSLQPLFPFNRSNIQLDLLSKINGGRQ